MSTDRAEHEGAAPGKAEPSAGDRVRAPEASEPSLPSGGTYFLGRYRIVDEIGVGGMASVHLARADGPGGFQKWVAIKRIHRHLAEDAAFIQMFLDEARIAARISHPNVAQVFDLGTHKDTYWIAMEYLHGEPLREVMRAAEEARVPRMEPELAAKVVSDAAEGLHAAHELRDKDGKLLNLVHRDVSPHNLFLTYDGAVKVVDFGIAKVTGRMSTTRAGTLKGKLAYMSPEQVRGAAIDRRTDVFALGVVLWELTTGRRLFRMETDLETLERVQACVVAPPSSIVEGYPVELESIVMRGLAKDVNRRFATARELSRALQQYLMHTGSFVGSDEIGAYVRDALSDRYEKREAHLQWAAEVTQTIAIDQLETRKRAADEVSILTDSSDVLEVVPPRPAAGAPPAPSTRPPASRSRMVKPATDEAPRSVEDALELPSYDVVTATGITEEIDVVDVAAEPPRAPLPKLAVGSALPAVAAPAKLAPPVASSSPPARPQPPPAPPLPAYELASSSGLETEPARHRYTAEDDAPTTVMGDDEPQTISTIHAPAKSVRPAPQPDANVVIAQFDSFPFPAAPRPLAPAEQAKSPDATVRRTAVARDSRILLLVTAAATTLIALALTTLVVIELTRDNRDPAPAASEVAKAAAAPLAADTESARSEQPLDPSTLPTEDLAKREATEPSNPAPAATAPRSTAAPRVSASGAGYLTIVCDPFCDSVQAGGRRLGPSPVVRSPLPAGTHAVVLRRKGSPVKTISVTIVGGQTTARRVKMGT